MRFVQDYNANVFEIFDQEWALLTAGNESHYNTMTIGWGGMGTLWGRAVVTVYVKPSRYTHSFMEESEYFTVSFYPKTYRKALSLLGSLSGRDGDKIAKSGLTPKPLKDAVTFEEAKVTLLCKKLYRQDMDVSAMPDYVVEDYYDGEEPHTMYVGRVVEILD